MAIIYTRKGQAILVDDCDYEELNRYRWYLNLSGYAQRNSNKAEYGNGRRKPILMHRQIMGFSVGMLIDHISGDKLDNRRSNLRLATRSQNSMNSKIYSNNKLGVKGIHFCKERNKFYACIRINNKGINLGRFNTIEEAVAARKRAEELHFGEFRYKNS